MLLKGRGGDDLLPLAAVLRDIVPDHPGGVLEHVREQASAQEGLPARLEHQVVAHRDGELSHGRDMRPEGGVIGGLVVAESGVPHQLEGQLLGGVTEDTAVKLPNPKHQSLYQLLKLPVGRLILGLVGVVPLPVIVGAQLGQIAQDHLYIHLSTPRASATVEKAGPFKKSWIICFSRSVD